MFRIPRSQLNRGGTLTTPTTSAASTPPHEVDSRSSGLLSSKCGSTRIVRTTVKRRQRPPTPVGGDGFPSVADELRTCTTTLTEVPVVVVGGPKSRGAGTSSPSSSYSFSTVRDEGDVGPECRDRRTGSRASDDASHDRRSVRSSRTDSENARGAPRRLQHSKLGACLMLAVLGLSSVVLLAVLLAYNTQFEQNIIHRVKAVFSKGLGKHLAQADVNSTHDTGVAGSVAEAVSSTTADPASRVPTLPESSEEFEHRLREMVTRFWTPRDENDFVRRRGAATADFPDANWDGDAKRSNASREDVAEIEQLWLEGDESDDVHGGRGYP
ncbi:hypothetical protein MTO96_027690 [Rhipicephalus appendiculatus]